MPVPEWPDTADYRRSSGACIDGQRPFLAICPDEISGQVMGIPPPPCLGECACCVWHLQCRPWRPSARLRPLAGAAGVVGGAATGGRSADLLDRLPLASQCPELARQHLPAAGSVKPRPAGEMLPLSG